MRLGCPAWVFSRDSPYEEAVKSIGALGFKGVELIATRESDLTKYYTPERNRKLTELCESCGLALSEFVLAGPDWWTGRGLSSFDGEEKKRAIQQFKRGVQITKELGTNIICFVSHWPFGIQTPLSYPPSYIYLTRGSPVSCYSPKLTIKFPKDFNWEKTWNNYVESIGMCADIASDNGILLAVEGHTHVIASTTDAFLRLFDEVESNSLGMNYDTGWQFIQREYVPLSIRKLGKKLLHMHLRDGDGVLNYDLPPGQGIIDWDEVVDALKSIRYDGFLSFELSYQGEDEQMRVLREGKEYIEKILSIHNVSN